MRTIGSLYVALVLMAVLAGVLVWGTFVEATYGAPTARFVLYDSPPFAVLLGLIGVNVAAAMLARVRVWKRQLPFFAAHIGILLLLIGSFVTARFGEEATLALFEGETGQVGQKASSCLAIRSQSIDTDADTTQRVAFMPGPQNWLTAMREDNTLAPSVRFAASLQQRLAKQTSFRGDGVTVEVLDYLAATTVTEVPPLELAVRWERPLATGETQNTPRPWETLQMAVRPRQSHPSMPAVVVTARGTRETTQGKERVTFAVAESMAEVAAFKRVTEVAPRGAGVCMLWCRGEVVTLDVAETLAEFAGGAASVALGSRGYVVEKFQWIKRMPMVTLEVVAPSGIRETLRLFADAPERNIAASELGIYGSYWINPNDESLALRNEPTYAMLSQPRLDLLQSPRGELFWRYWNGASLVDAGQVELAAGANDTFKSQTISVAAGTPNATPNTLSFAVNKFVPHDFAGVKFRAATVSRETTGLSTARVKLRLTVEGVGREDCWLREFVSATGLAPERDQIARLYTPDRTVSVVFTGDVVDLGFAVRLNRFTQQNEPGTRMAAGFTSLVDEIAPQPSASPISHQTERRVPTPDEILRKDIVIRMNHPGTFRSAKTGRIYRVYQASRSGPFRSGDGVFEQLYDGELFSGEKTPREEIWRSVLSVNYDPGRGIKYLGCFLLIVGTGMFAFRRANVIPATFRHSRVGGNPS